MTTVETITDGQTKVAALEDYIAERQISFDEAMAKYDVISASHDPVHGSYVIMADKSANIAPGLAVQEMGYSSPSPWTSWTREERVPELRDRQGLRTYYDMKRADGTIRGALRLLKTPILAARWFVEPASDSTIDKNIAEFVSKNLFEQLTVPWERHVEDALLMCEYGYMAFEKVWVEPYSPADKVQDGKLRLQKLAPRHPLDIQEWLWDANGGPDAFVMEPISIEGYNGSFNNLRTNLTTNNYNANAPYGTTWQDPRIEIPISKALIFTLEQEGGDLRGTSILRSAYKHYYYKDTLYKIDAIQKERHGIGVPIIKLPPGFSKADRDLAQELGRNLRTNERAHIVVPSNWEVAFAILGGNPVDCVPSIEHHDMKIKSNIMAAFMDESNVNPDSLDVYYKSTRYIANTVCSTHNHYLIPQMVGMNFSRGANPKLRVRRIGEEEALRTMSFAFRNFVGANAIIPDDPLEKFLRNELDLPPADPKTKREAQAPQAGQPLGAHTDSNNPNNPPNQKPGEDNQKPAPHGPQPPHVGPPRQPKTAQVNVGKKNVGTDNSGGK